MILHPLFHWAPRERRESITEQGLVPDSEPTCSSRGFPYICCCISPSQAWSLSALCYPEIAEVWDCWQIVLNQGDSVEVLPVWGNRLEEIRIHNALKPDQLFMVGERQTRLPVMRPTVYYAHRGEQGGILSEFPLNGRPAQED